LGGNIVADRSELKGGPRIPGMTALGMDTRLYLDFGPVDFMTGLQPDWFVAGDRPSRGENGPMGGFGDELSIKTGVRVWIFAATWTYTTNAFGRIDSVIVGLDY
jgi:hypothetical protein